MQRLNGSWRIAAYSALCWLIWIPAFDVGRIGLNDPHLLGVAISLAGLYCYLRDPESTRCLCLSAGFFALSLFIKHSLVAFPAAVAIQLFLSSRKRFWTWFITAVAACSILLLITLAVDGRYFLANLTMPRAYYPWDLVTSTRIYLSFAQVAFVVAVIWALRSTAFSSTYAAHFRGTSVAW